MVRAVLDEVFGVDHAIATICYKKPGQRAAEFLPILTDFILWYGKDASQTKYRQLYVPKVLAGEGGDHYTQVEQADKQARPLSFEERINPSSLPPGAKVFETTSLTSA